MNPSLVPLLDLLKLDTGLLERAIDGLQREQLLRRIPQGANPMLWIAGHLTSVRFGMATLLGEARTRPWGTMFGRGVPVPEDAALPQAAEVLSEWRTISEAVVRLMTAATDAQLAAPSPRPFPIADKTILGAVTFLVYHESYHLGQMALIRKGLGLPGLVDG
jgi:hypothetical protein